MLRARRRFTSGVSSLSEIGIVKAEHRDRRAHHVHRRRVLRRALEEIDDALRQLALRAQGLAGIAPVRRDSAVCCSKQINDFLVADLAGQFVDVVAAVNELAFVADDIAQPRGVRDDAFESAGNRHAFPFIRAINVSAIVAGVSATAMPAALSASIFPAAVPLPPETIAPA